MQDFRITVNMNKITTINGWETQSFKSLHCLCRPWLGDHYSVETHICSWCSTEYLLPESVLIFYLYISACQNRKRRKSGALGKQSQSLWLPFYCIVPFRHVYIKADKLCLLWQLNKLPVSPSVFGLENKGTKVASGTGKQNTSPQPADPLSNYFCQGYRMFRILQVLRVF